VTTIGTPRSQYAQIAELLRDRIADGTYPRGEPLPSEDRLSAELGVSRVTINRAIGLLRSTGEVRVRRGVGTVVRSLPRITRDANTRHTAPHHGTGSTEREITGLGLRPRTDYREVGETVPPPEVRRILAAAAGERALVRRRVVFADDEPTELADSYYPWSVAERLPPVPREAVGCGGSYRPFVEAGLAPARFTEEVDVRMATEAEQRELDLEPTQVVFQTQHVAYTGDDQPIEVCLHVMPGHLWTLRFGWDE
jgi:GntR family transcriptional regulator